MNSTATLRMPEHLPVSPPEDPRDVCRGAAVPGYALQQPDGRLHCNRCGWVTPEPVVTCHSNGTGNTYLTWDELVAAEANGYTVVVVSERSNTVPAVFGPWPDPAAAHKAQSRLRRSARKHEHPHKVKTYVRVLWKEDRHAF